MNKRMKSQDTKDGEAKVWNEPGSFRTSLSFKLP